jgi:hypothetical protein
MTTLPESNRPPSAPVRGSQGSLLGSSLARGSSLVGARARWARSLRWALGGALATVLVGGLALAQAPAQPSDPTQVGAGLTRQVNLTPAEMVTQSESVLVRLDGSRSTVRRMLETARAARDVVKTLCLNDKLNQLDVAIRSARERKQALDAAASRNDSDLANHEFTIISVLRQRGDQLTAEANQCIGQEAGFVGESAVTAQIDPGIPPESDDGLPGSGIIAQPPGCFSCLK